ncbi:MAG: LuxR C-terminal-related transcriptional regulator [Planctomycetota bacterium]
MHFSEKQVRGLIRTAQEVSFGESFEECAAVLHEQIQRLVPCSSFSAFVVAPGFDQPYERGFVADLDAQVGRDYTGEYMLHDPLVPRCMANPEKPVVLANHLYRRGPGRDPFSGEFLPQHGVEYVMAMMATLPEGAVLAVAFHREPCLRDFSEQERLMVELVSPAITNAVSRVLVKDRGFFDTVAVRAGLTEAERSVALLAAAGYSNKEIATRLDKSPTTVGVQLSSVYRKCSVEGRTQLARMVHTERPLR